MIYGPAFYKLLGIPESVAEPTAYHLLDLDPRMITEAIVEGALKERKARLRQSIPGPQFIPIVSLIEQELNQAAAILRDPQRRREYDDQLLRGPRKRARKQGGPERRKLVEACREAVRDRVDADGCLPDERRGELAGELDRIGLPADQVQYVLEHVPSPARKEGEASEDERRQKKDEAMRFFVAAIDLEVDRGLLDDPSERKLMKMAERFGIPPALAAEKIDHCLAELGAQRGGRDESSLVGQFKLHVLALYPMGDATGMDRRRLLSLAAAEGLSVRQAERVLREYLPPPSDELQEGGGLESSTAGDPMGVLKELARTSPGPPSRRRTWARYAADAIVTLVLAAAVIGVWKGIEVWSGGRGPRPPGGPQTAPVAGGPAGPDTRPAPTRPALLAKAFDALPSREAVRKVFQGATATARTEALVAAAEILVVGATPRDRVLVRGIYDALLDCPPAEGRVQDAAVGALIGRLRAVGKAGRGQPKGLYRGAGRLASMLFLRRTPGVAVRDPGAMEAFLDRCTRAWADSRAMLPADPANDPRRLAYAVMAGGSLTMYAGRADRVRFAAVTAQLVGVAADPLEPGSQEALAALLDSGAYSGYRPDIRDTARLALCDVIQTTLDRQVARKAQAVLASVLRLAYDDPRRSDSLGTDRERTSAAAALRLAVEAGSGRLAASRPAASQAATSRPASTQPGSRPATSQPRRGGVALAERVRATWTDRTDAPAVLTDLAGTMLACADRVAHLSARSDALTGELLGVLNEGNPTLRAARLTRRVRTVDEAGSVPLPGAAALEDGLAGRIKRDIRSSRAAVRNATIEQLRVLDDAAAVAVLVDRLSEIVQSARPDLPATNRILQALLRMSDAGIPAKLAALIQPARTNYTAHRLVMILLDGSGLAGSTDRLKYQLPISHNAKQRSLCAGRWKDLAASCPWGPRRMTGAVAGPVGPPPAWRPDPTVEKLLAVLVHYSRLTGRMLQAYKPAADADVPKPPEIRPAKARIVAPVREEELTEALDRVATELTRLARRHANAKAFAVRIDMIALRAKSRKLACETALQRSAVALDTAGRILEILVLQADGKGGEGKAVVEEIRRRHGRAVAENVLIEMRELCCHNLLLLGMLSKEGP